MKRFVWVALALASCGAPPSEPVEPPRPPGAPPPLASYDADWVGFEVPGEEICKKNPDGTLKFPIAAGTYQGILRNVRCRQQKFLTMAWMSDTLGVDCDHCHVKDPSDPEKYVFESWTENKRAANWMYRAFVQGLRAVDGSRVGCASCHVGGDGKPVMKILGTPREPARVSEWMHAVMVSNFVEADGDRLRCRTCHEGMAPGSDDWQREVILEVAREGDAFVRAHLEADPAELAPPANEGAGGGAPVGDAVTPEHEGREGHEGDVGSERHEGSVGSERHEGGAGSERQGRDEGGEGGDAPSEDDG